MRAFALVFDYCETIGLVESVERARARPSDVFVRFQDVSDALMAESLLNQRTVAGCTLQASVQPFFALRSVSAPPGFDPSLATSNALNLDLTIPHERICCS